MVEIREEVREAKWKGELITTRETSPKNKRCNI